MRNKIIKTLTWINALVFVVMATAIDSDSYIPAIVCLICLTWLLPVTWANRERFK